MAERRIDRHYGPLIAKAKGEDRQNLESVHRTERDMISEERDEIRMGRLWRKARKYPTVVIPERTVSSFAVGEDESWTRGRVYGGWCLKRQAEAYVWLQIDEAKKRRREAWLAWVPIVAAIATLVSAGAALVSALVALTALQSN
jgi:hypothetical protein